MVLYKLEQYIEAFVSKLRLVTKHIHRSWVIDTWFQFLEVDGT